MASKKIIKTDTLSTTGGIYNIDISENFDFYILTGTGSLSGSWSIVSSTPSKGDYLEILLDTSFVRGLNNISVLGVALNDLSNGRCYIQGLYDGSWKVSVTPYYNNTSNSQTVFTTLIKDASITTAKMDKNAIDTSKLGNESVTEDIIATESISENKIQDGAITSSKLQASNKIEIITIPVSFESGEQARNRIIAPFNGIIKQVTYTVTKSIAATDSATVEVLINGIPTLPASISIPASTGLNTTSTTTITSSNTFTDNQSLDFTSAKPTPGGKVLLSIELERT